MRSCPSRVASLFCLYSTAAILLGCSDPSDQNKPTLPYSSGGQPGAGGGAAGASSSGGPAYVAGANSTAGDGSNGAELGGGAGALPASAGAAGAAQEGGGAGMNGLPSTAGAAGTDGDIISDVPLDRALLSKCSGSNPILCKFDAPNGNYDVTAEVGDAAVAATSRLSAETLHYQGPAVDTAAGTFKKLTFTVNVRMEKHDGGQSAPASVLDVTISSKTGAPKLHGIGFRPAKDAVTLFYAGDSTACDWVDSNTSNLGPGETGSAQALSMYLKPGAAVANYADSGETAGGFYSKFFDPYATALFKEGDYVFVQFGTNDSKDAATTANAGKVYKDNLMMYVTAARAKKAIPVILTPVSRKGGTADSPGFAGLDQAARDLAAAQGVALVDMTALSRAYYATVADKNALFVDSGTHFSELGAAGVAATLSNAIQSGTLTLKAFVK
ncbi:MAG: GDSL-type esterase/lipase family protein [Polyangiaceae bacterium]